MVSAIENWAIIEGPVLAAVQSEIDGCVAFEIEVQTVREIEGHKNLMDSKLGETVVVHIDRRAELESFPAGDRCRLRVKVTAPNRIVAHPSEHERIGPAAAASGAVSSRPVLFLDVGGVLHPTAETAPAGFREESVGERTLFFSPEHRRWLMDLAEPFELVWASDWGADANELSPRYWITELPVVELAPGATPADRLEAIRDYAGDRPAVWISASLPDEAAQWAHDRSVATLLIEPDATQGLIADHIESLRRFLAG